MGKKYIIELLDDCPSEFKGIIVFGLTPDGQISAEPIPVEDLTPYTEPHTAYWNEYKRGYETAKHECEDCTKGGKYTADDAFQKGYDAALDDLWEAMQKAIKMYCEIDNEVFLRVFYDVKCDWGESVLQALFKNTPQHLIDSIRKYEQRQEEQIQVGDEVNAPFGKAIVVNIDTVAEKIWLVYTDGHGGFEYFKDAPRKTGRHFPEIAEVLRKMKESDNG